MKCAKCDTELHNRALHCWKCGQATPNYTDELKARYQKDEAERLRDERAWVNPEAVPSSGKKLVRVYKRTWFGRRLAGWLDEYGNTYKSHSPFRPVRQLDWSVDEQGHIYISAGEYQTVVGWVEYHEVFAQYGRPASGFFSYPENMWFFKPRVSFAPNLAFQISDDGTVYRPVSHSSRSIGKVVGAPDFSTIAALALIILL